MQAAASQTVGLGVGSRGKRVGRVGMARPSATVEVALELHATRLADLELLDEPAIDVMPRERSESVSRAVNIVLAAVALVIISPLLALIALAIKLTSRGPILYSQTRVGVDRRYRETTTYDRRGHDHGG